MRRFDHLRHLTITLALRVFARGSWLVAALHSALCSMLSLSCAIDVVVLGSQASADAPLFEDREPAREPFLDARMQSGPRRAVSCFVPCRAGPLLSLPRYAAFDLRGVCELRPSVSYYRELSCFAHLSAVTDCSVFLLFAVYAMSKPTWHREYRTRAGFPFAAAAVPRADVVSYPPPCLLLWCVCACSVQRR